MWALIGISGNREEIQALVPWNDDLIAGVLYRSSRAALLKVIFWKFVDLEISTTLSAAGVFS